MERKARGVQSRKRKADEETNDVSMLNKMAEIISTAMAPITERLEELEHRSSSTSSVTPEVLTTTNRLTSESRVLMVQTPTKPIFSGKDLHPMDFMENLQKYITKMGYHDASLDTALDCLIGEAKNWSKIYLHKWQSFEEFRVDFMNQYWGREAQNQIKRKLGSQKWTPHCGKRMTEYFTELFSEAKRLTSYSNDDAIVDDIMQHYPQDIRRLWVTKESRGAIAAVEFLKSIESVSSNEESPNHQNFPVRNYQTQVRQQQGNHDRSRIARAAALETVRVEHRRNWRPAEQQPNIEVVNVEDNTTTPRDSEGN